MKFMALGGTDHIGASCYYLELDGTRFLLDLGRGFHNGGISYGPDFDTLLQRETTDLTSLSQINAVLLSHGHYDHAAALPDFTAHSPEVPVYATTLTHALMDYLLLDRLHYDPHRSQNMQFIRRIQTLQGLERVQHISYLRPFYVGNVEITAYEAGHVPGAAMFLLKSSEGNVLYTGDFMMEKTALTHGVLLPENLRPDVAILCGTHAQHPNWQRRRKIELDSVRQGLNTFREVFITTTQLTKGLEVAKYLGEYLSDEPIYLDEPILALAERLERVSCGVLNGKFCPFPQDLDSPSRPKGIYIGGKEKSNSFQWKVRGDFSLHASYEDCVKLIRQI